MLKVLNTLHEKRKIRVIYTNLPGGDYLINNYLVERKSVFDFAQSKRDNRLWSQTNYLLHAAKNGFKPIVLIEGNWQELVDSKRMGWWEINILMNEIELRKEIATIRTFTPYETAYRLASIAQLKGLTGTSNLQVGRKSMKPEWSLYEKQEYVLDGFRGIGTKTSQKLLEFYDYKLAKLLYDMAYADVLGVKLTASQSKAVKQAKQVLKGLK